MMDFHHAFPLRHVRQLAFQFGLSEIRLSRISKVISFRRNFPHIGCREVVINVFYEVGTVGLCIYHTRQSMTQLFHCNVTMNQLKDIFSNPIKNFGYGYDNIGEEMDEQSTKDESLSLISVSQQLLDGNVPLPRDSMSTPSSDSSISFGGNASVEGILNEQDYDSQRRADCVSQHLSLPPKHNLNIMCFDWLPWTQSLETGSYNINDLEPITDDEKSEVSTHYSTHIIDNISKFPEIANDLESQAKSQLQRLIDEKIFIEEEIEEVRSILKDIENQRRNDEAKAHGKVKRANYKHFSKDSDDKKRSDFPEIEKLERKERGSQNLNNIIKGVEKETLCDQQMQTMTKRMIKMKVPEQRQVMESKEIVELRIEQSQVKDTKEIIVSGKEQRQG